MMYSVYDAMYTVLCCYTILIVYVSYMDYDLQQFTIEFVMIYIQIECTSGAFCNLLFLSVENTFI